MSGGHYSDLTGLVPFTLGVEFDVGRTSVDHHTLKYFSVKNLAECLHRFEPECLNITNLVRMVELEMFHKSIGFSVVFDIISMLKNSVRCIKSTLSIIPSQDVVLLNTTMTENKCYLSYKIKIVMYQVM